jgi:hypothetical protein
MKVYTVSRQDKYDYDFSVESIKIGCYADLAKAIAAAKREYIMMVAQYDDEIDKYADTEMYDPNEPDSGALYTEVDNDHGFYAVNFGYHEDYESHVVWVDEWDVM